MIAAALIGTVAMAAAGTGLFELARASRLPRLPGVRVWLLSAGAWMALRLGAASLATLLALPFGSALPGRMSLLLLLGAPVAGFVAPDRWLARVEKHRLDLAVRELPDMLDLLRVTVEAGMPPGRALGVVAGEFEGPLAVELKRLAAEIAFGIPQDQALAGLAQRLPAEEIDSFVQAVARSRRRGVPLGRALAMQAGAARHRRRKRLRERAARAGPKIQLVVALLLVPSVLLMVAAALFAELERLPFRLPA